MILPKNLRALQSIWDVSYLQVLHGDLHAGQVHVGHPGAGALRPVAHREHVGERLPHHRLVAGDGGHGSPVALVGDESGDPGHLVVRGDPDPAGGGPGEGGPKEAEEEHTCSPRNSAHVRLQSALRVGETDRRTTYKQHRYPGQFFKIEAVNEFLS